HTIDECMHLKRQIEEMLKAGKLSHLVKEIKQGNRKDQAKSVISFLPLREEDGTEGTMIIKDEIEGHFVHRMYVDGGSSSKILYEQCFNRFRPEVTISIQRNHRKARGKEDPGRPGTRQPVINQVTEEKIKVAIHPEYQEQTIAIGSTLTEEGRTELSGLLRRNLDVFVWKPTDMTRVTCRIAEHKLYIHEGCLPIRQKKIGQAPERNKVIHEEVEKLVNAGIMKEVHYHSWLSNSVMVKKHDDNWRMCVDFIDLNKACPKDGYPLSGIDWTVESLCGYPLKCFLDGYKGYRQIKMAKEDVKKTTFITSQGIFCYTKTSLGLKNARATYQRLVDKAFQK
nr:reverse transcriptase domain-containing protein [Tanacetum cinerariifolium]